MSLGIWGHIESQVPMDTQVIVAFNQSLKPVQDMMALSMKGLPNSLSPISIINFFQSNYKTHIFLVFKSISILDIAVSPKKFLLKQSHNYVMSVYKNPRVSRVRRIIFFFNFIKTQARNQYNYCRHVMLVKAAIEHSQVQRKEKQTLSLDGKIIFMISKEYIISSSAQVREANSSKP